MAPILEQRAVRIRHLVDQVPPVRTEAREQRHVMRPHADVDGVELQETDPPQHSSSVATIHRAARHWIGEALSAEGNAARPADGE